MNQKVLIIDDDINLLALLESALGKAGYDISVASGGVEGLHQMYSIRPDIVILDVMMPGMDGGEVCSRIRELSDVPIIMLTAKSDEEDKLRGFNLGVDDYVTKPFSVAELIARIEAVTGRVGKYQLIKKPTIYSGRGLVIDEVEHRVTLDGERVELTPREFSLLLTLAEGHGRLVTTDLILRKVWGAEYIGETEHVKHYIWRLRSKIETDGQRPPFIITERGVGYRLVLEG